MAANADAASEEALQVPRDSGNSSQGNKGKDTLMTEASFNVEAQFSPAMLLQMKTLIEDVIDGAVEKRLHVLGMNPRNSDPQHEPQEGGGSKSTPAAHKQKPRNLNVVQELATRSPSMATVQEEGFLTDWESPEEEDPQEHGDDLGENTTNAWAKKCAQQEEQMKLLMKELERLKKHKKIPEKTSREAEADEGAIHTADEGGNPKHISIQKNGEHKSELSSVHIDENSPFSADIQTDPITGNFMTVSCEYQGKGDPEEHLMKFESLCLLHQYSEGVKCRVFLTTLSGTAQHWFKQLPKSSIHSFQDLREVFLQQFVSAKRTTQNSLHLTTIKQGANESLRDYMTHFNEAVLEIPGWNQN